MPPPFVPSNASIIDSNDPSGALPGAAVPGNAGTLGGVDALFHVLCIVSAPIADEKTVATGEPVMGFVAATFLEGVDGAGGLASWHPVAGLWGSLFPCILKPLNCFWHQAIECQEKRSAFGPSRSPGTLLLASGGPCFLPF